MRQTSVWHAQGDITLAAEINSQARDCGPSATRLNDGGGLTQLHIHSQPSSPSSSSFSDCVMRSRTKPNAKRPEHREREEARRRNDKEKRASPLWKPSRLNKWNAGTHLILSFWAEFYVRNIQISVYIFWWEHFIPQALRQKKLLQAGGSKLPQKIKRHIFRCSLTELWVFTTREPYSCVLSDQFIKAMACFCVCTHFYPPQVDLDQF